MHSKLIDLELSDKWFRLRDIEYFCTGVSKKGKRVIVFTNLRTFVWLYPSEYDGICILNKTKRPSKIPSGIALGNTFDLTQTKRFESYNKKQLRLEYKNRIIQDRAEKDRIRKNRSKNKGA